MSSRELPEGYYGVCGRNCVATLRFSDGTRLRVYPEDKLRLIVVEDVGSATVVVGFASSASEFDEHAAEVEKVIDTVRRHQFVVRLSLEGMVLAFMLAFLAWAIVAIGSQSVATGTHSQATGSAPTRCWVLRAGELRAGSSAANGRRRGCGLFREGPALHDHFAPARGCGGRAGA